MSNTLGCGSNIPDGSCIGKQGDWTVTYNTPITRKVALKRTHYEGWQFFPPDVNICQDVDWQFFPYPLDKITTHNFDGLTSSFYVGYTRVWGTYSVGFGTGVWAAFINTREAFDDFLPKRIQDIELELVSRSNINNLIGSQYKDIEALGVLVKNKETGKERELAISCQEAVGQIVDGKLFVPDGFLSGRYILNQSTYPSNVSVTSFDVNRRRFTGLTGCTIEGFEVATVSRPSPFILEVLYNGEHYQYYPFSYTPYTIKAVQDEFFPEYQRYWIVDPSTRRNKFALTLSGLLDNFYLEQLRLLVSYELTQPLIVGTDIDERPTTIVEIAPSPDLFPLQAVSFVQGLLDRYQDWEALSGATQPNSNGVSSEEVTPSRLIEFKEWLEEQSDYVTFAAFFRFFEKYELWLLNKCDNGSGAACYMYSNLLPQIHNILNWLRAEDRVYKKELLRLEASPCSALFPSACWDCRSGCPEGTCFKCVDNVDQKICCYGTGGKAIATVGLDEDIPDC
jgi:hypothetical protein